jgi:hypothetical protein
MTVSILAPKRGPVGFKPNRCVTLRTPWCSFGSERPLHLESAFLDAYLGIHAIAMPSHDGIRLLACEPFLPI